MTVRSLIRRVRAMPAEEIVWRFTERARTTARRTRTRVAAPRWRRSDLAGRLSTESPAWASAAEALRRRDWVAAHEALSRHFLDRAARFVLHPGACDRVRPRVLARDPDAAAAAAAVADRMVDGWYDLLGYEGLRFSSGSGIDWHFDPVSGRRAPRAFWADVPYLDPAGGDHKVIWELNRHQHWLLLGRAFRLTGDPRYRREFERQLQGWLTANPPEIGINWASALELALRSLSWLWALEFFTTAPAPGDSPWTVDLLLGIDRQLCHVEQHLSKYFSPNTHLLGEALALYVCGRALPELAASSRWTRIGRDVLIAESTRQVLPDGVHAERSTHYHRYTLDFYLLALAVARITDDRGTAHRLEPVVHRLAEFMFDVSDCAGRYPLIGDDDGGELAPVAGRTCGNARVPLGWAAGLLGRPGLAVGPAPEAVFWLTAVSGESAGDTRPPGEESGAPKAYPDGGYFISRHGRSHLVFDAGRHGFLNGGHAHADALAICLTADGLPLLVDGGTATYTMDRRLRDYFRSTHAHNTVTIDGRSQSQPLGPFHWRTVAHAAPSRLARNPRFDYFEGTTEAYAPLRHERLVLALDDHRWVVADRIRRDPADPPGAQHEAVVRWHFHPDWQAVHDGRGEVLLSTRTGARARLGVVGARLDLVTGGAPGEIGCVSPEYGRVAEAPAVQARVVQTAPLTVVTTIEAGAPPGPARARFVEVLTAESGDCPIAVVSEGASTIGVTLFGSASREMRTVIVDPRRGLTVSTDARMLHARMTPGGRLVRASAVDCSVLRIEGAEAVTLLTGPTLPDIDLAPDTAGSWGVSSSGRLEGVDISIERGDSRAGGSPGSSHVWHSGVC